MPIPKKGAIPGRRLGKSSDAGFENLVGVIGGIGNLLESVFKSVGKTIESVQNLKLEDLEKIAEAKGDQEAKERIRTFKESLGKSGQQATIKNLLSGEGLDLSKLDLTKLIKQGGLRISSLGKTSSFGNMPFVRRGPQETKFEVKGTRLKKVQKTMEAGPKEIEVRKIEIDPIEEDENSVIIRGYMAGVDEKDIVCQIENEKNLKISAKGERKYEKVIKLSSPVDKKVKWAYRNGILEVTLTKVR